MYNIELYESISKGDIQDSLYLSSKILLTNEISIDIFENTLIAICSYIGLFINIFDIKKWLDVINDTKKIIDDENINIKNIFILITKMCMLCDIYIKKPVSKTGNINLKNLRIKIIDVFSGEDSKLSTNGIVKFGGIIPPIDSDSYNLSLQVISGFIKLIKTTDNLSSDDGDTLFDVSNKLRHCFDYIIRKKYMFETKFYISDNDSVWFIWGFISILYNEDFFNNIFFLFSHNWNKKCKKYKIGLIYGSAISIIYSHKKDVSSLWNDKEYNVINKIKDISLTLFNEIKSDLFKNKEFNNIDEDANINNKTTDGLDIISSFIPLTLNTNNYYENKNNDDENTIIDNKKFIKFKSSKK